MHRIAAERVPACMLRRSGPILLCVDTSGSMRGVRRETLGSFTPAAAFGMQRDRAENRADRSVTIIFVR